MNARAKSNILFCNYGLETRGKFKLFQIGGRLGDKNTGVCKKETLNTFQ